MSKLNEPHNLRKHLTLLGYSTTLTEDSMVKLYKCCIVEIFIPYKSENVVDTDFSHKVIINETEYYTYFTDERIFDGFIVDTVAKQYADDKLESFRKNIMKNIFKK